MNLKEKIIADALEYRASIAERKEAEKIEFLASLDAKYEAEELEIKSILDTCGYVEPVEEIVCEENEECCVEEVSQNEVVNEPKFDEFGNPII